MVFNATFNNISVISWQSVFIGGGKTEYPENTTDLSQVTEDERLEDYTRSRKSKKERQYNGQKIPNGK